MTHMGTIDFDDLLGRGIANIIPGRKKLEELLLSSKKLNIYLGIDPTATKIHIGHAVPLRKLQAFATLGHNVTFLIGDFTALIGDTSDKDAERPVLTSDEIEKNFQTYKKQAEKIVDFSLPNVHVVKNSQWLKQLSFEEIVKLCQHFSVGDFVGRELIRRRLDQNKRVGLHEVLYPVMQGYDSYHLDTDIQIGGTDQTFNMQAGRTLQKNLRSKESFVLAMEFLIGTDGQKMSKTGGNAIWLEETPEEMFGKIMSIHDDVVIQYFILATNVTLQEIEEIKKRLHQGENPRDVKKQLARQIISEFYSEEKAETAQKEFENVIQQKQLPTTIPTISIALENGLISYIDLLLKTNMVATRSEARRLIEQGGVEIDNQKVIDINGELVIKDPIVLRVGKRKFVEVTTVQ